MIILLYTQYDHPLSSQLFDRYLNQLPQSLAYKVTSYRKWEDQQNTLFGKILLKKGLEMMGQPSSLLDTIRYNCFKKPFIVGGIDFNVSHSGTRIAVVMSDSHRVGIDVENILPVDIVDFKTCWSDDEWQEITHSTKRYHTFYSLWTRKEAVVKAEGAGLNIPLRDVNVMQDSVLLNDNCWHLKSLSLFDQCAVHIALDKNASVNEIITASTTF